MAKICLILRADLYSPWPILRAIREVELLRSQGKNVTVISWIKEKDSRFPSREVKDGVEIKRVFLEPPKSIISRFPTFMKVNRLLAKEAITVKPDGVLVHDLEVLRAGVIVKKELEVPLLYHTHEDWPAMVSERSRLEASVFSFLEKRYCRHVEHVYVPSEGIGKKYRDWGLRVTVQYATKSTSSLPKMTPDLVKDLRARYGLSEKDFIIGVAGSLGRSEALHNILIALKSLPPYVKLLIIGGLEEKVRGAKDLATMEGVSDRVSYTGVLDTEPYMMHISMLDLGLALFIGKTLNVVHVAPIKLFDYIAMGVPVMVSDYPTMKKIVEDAGCGIVVNPENPSWITTAISQLIEDEQRRNTMSKAARAAFVSKFCWEKQQITFKNSNKILN